jgi:hypothetical protein
LVGSACSWTGTYRRRGSPFSCRLHGEPDFLAEGEFERMAVWAIEAACRLMDDGCDVYGVGTGPLTDSIEKEQIDRIYAMWERARHPFGFQDKPVTT